MKFGISSRPSGDCCSNCKKPVDINNSKENFCSYCGVPLKISALQVRENEYKVVKIDLIKEIEERIVDENIKDILDSIKQDI